MVLLRHLLGDALRRLRLRQGRTLREVSAAARVSLGYLSEVERGQKEASSELLASICGALGAPLSQVLREVSDNFALAELQSEPVFAGVREPSPELVPVPGQGERGGRGDGDGRGERDGAERVPAGPSAQLSRDGRVRQLRRVGEPVRVTVPAGMAGRDGAVAMPVLGGPALAGTSPLGPVRPQPHLDRIPHEAYDIPGMVPV
jgi:transcriptional regulator with XRE-family HTH domain